MPISTDLLDISRHAALVPGFDAGLLHVIALFLGISLGATTAASLLAPPIVAALAHRAADEIWSTYGDNLRISGATPLQFILTMLAIVRAEMLTAVLAGFGRTISEVGAILVVGGNIAGYTRTMTTSIVLETSRGNLAFALALSSVLAGVGFAVSAAAFALAGRRDRAAPPPPP